MLLSFWVWPPIHSFWFFRKMKNFFNAFSIPYYFFSPPMIYFDVTQRKIPTEEDNLFLSLLNNCVRGFQHLEIL